MKASRIRRRLIKRNLGKSQILVNELQCIADDNEATVSQVALYWLVNYHNETVVAIPGATKPLHAEQNAQTLTLKLTQNELNSIAELSEQFI